MWEVNDEDAETPHKRIHGGSVDLERSKIRSCRLESCPQVCPCWMRKEEHTSSAERICSFTASPSFKILTLFTR